MAYKMTKARVRQLRRVRSLIRSFKKRGYEFDVETGVMLRDLSKVSTVQLAKIKPKYLYKRSTKVVDGQRVSGLRGRNIEYERRSQKAAQTRKRRRMVEEESRKRGYTEGAMPNVEDVIVDNFMNIIRQFDTWAARFIINTLNDMIDRLGKKAVARGLERAPQPLKDRIIAFAYNSDNESESMTRAIVAAMRIIENLATQQELDVDETKDLLHQIAPWRGRRKGMHNPRGADLDWVNRIAEEMEFE